MSLIVYCSCCKIHWTYAKGKIS